VEIYAIVNRLGGPGTGQAARDLTLQLPAARDDRLPELAKALGGAGGSHEERVRRTLFHLDRCCRYSLKVPRPASRDPVAGFLFETRRGYCEYFATAAALLLRLQGVPTRYVTGFNVRDESVVAGHYLVRESDAHAWIESYIPGQGWLEFDPTPSAQYAEVHDQSRPGSMAALFERLLALMSELDARLRAGSLLSNLRWALRGAGPALGAVALLSGMLVLRRRLSRRSRTVFGGRPNAEELDPHVRELLARVDRLLLRHGHPRPPARAPQEHLDALPQAALEPALRAEAARAVRCFYRARYGGERPAGEEVDELLQRLPPA
jgi:transglutaminase-like putative cysteine protease